jgi:hypothetical protein
MTTTFENVLPANSDTVLAISGFGHLLYQARGLQQTLSIINAAKHTERTINGALIDVSAPQFRKFITKITCGDINAPPLDNVWPGMEITVHCACQLAYLTGNSGSPCRPVVSGSSYVQGSPSYTFYRPVLTMLVTSVDNNLDEWKADYKWALEAEEV